MRHWVPLLDFQFLLFILWLDVSTFCALSCPVAFHLFPSALCQFMISSNPISILLSWGFDLLCFPFAPFPSASQLDWTTLWHVMPLLVLSVWLMEGAWWTHFRWFKNLGCYFTVQFARSVRSALILHQPPPRYRRDVRFHFRWSTLLHASLLASGYQTTLIHSSSGPPVIRRRQFARPILPASTNRPVRHLPKSQSPRSPCPSRSTELPCVAPDLASQRLSSANSSCGLLPEHIKSAYYQDYFEACSDLSSPP